MTARERRPTGFVHACLCLLAAAALAGLLLPLAMRLALPAPLRWPLDLAVHWQWPYALAFACACLVGAWWRRRWLLLLPLCALPWATASDALLPDAGDAPALRVAFANVNVANADPAPLLAWIAREPVDVLAIAELSPAYADALRTRGPASLPHRTLHPLTTPWGLGLLSRAPLRDVRLVPGADGRPRLEALVEAEGQTVRLVVLHPRPPLDAAMRAERDRMVREVAAGIGADPHDTPAVVVGDFNATPWSPPLRAAAAGGLARATGLAPTWPASWRLLPGIPIDHVLATWHWSAGRTSRGPDVGSDHLPVRAELHWVRDL